MSDARFTAEDVRFLRASADSEERRFDRGDGLVIPNQIPRSMRDLADRIAGACADAAEIATLRADAARWRYVRDSPDWYLWRVIDSYGDDQTEAPTDAKVDELMAAEPLAVKP